MSLLLQLTWSLCRPHAIHAAYMVQKLGIPADEVAAKTLELYLGHGTTLAGLVVRGVQRVRHRGLGRKVFGASSAFSGMMAFPGGQRD